MVTNYEQLITPRWHCVEQQNTIRHRRWISGGGLKGANSSVDVKMNYATLNFPKEQKGINNLLYILEYFCVGFAILYVHCMKL